MPNNLNDNIKCKFEFEFKFNYYNYYNNVKFEFEFKFNYYNNVKFNNDSNSNFTRYIPAAAPCAPILPIPRVKIHTRGNIWSLTVG